MKKTKLLALLIIASCLAGCTNREMGTGIGATSGFLIGSAIGDNSIGAGVGTAIGAGVGNVIGGKADSK